MNISNLILEIASKNSLLSDEDYTIIENNLEIIENLMFESQVSDSKEALNNLFKVFPIEDDYYSQTFEGLIVILRKNIPEKDYYNILFKNLSNYDAKNKGNFSNILLILTEWGKNINEVNSIKKFYGSNTEIDVNKLSVFFQEIMEDAISFKRDDMIHVFQIISPPFA